MCVFLSEESRVGARSGSKQQWMEEEKAKKKQSMWKQVVVVGVERIVGASREIKQSIKFVFEQGKQE